MRLSSFLVEKTLNEYSKLVYHNREHAERMLEGFGTWVDSRSDIPDILVRIGEASILFHDVQYVISRKNNEEVACEYARKALEPCGWNKHFIQAVRDIIMTTVPFTDFSPTFNYFPRIQKGLHDLVDIIHDLDWFGFSSEEMVLQHHEKIFQEAYYHIGEGFAFIRPRINFLKFDIRKNQCEFYRKLKEKVVSDGYLFRSEYFNYISLEETLFNIDAVIDKARDDMYYAYKDLKEEVRKWNEENPDYKKELPPDPFEEKGAKMNKEFWKRNDRQFKFRVWQDGRFLSYGTGGWIYEGNTWIVKLGGDVVQQFTGCKDIDGKEIFEGDILETDEAGWIGVVVFGGGGFGLEDKEGGFSSFPNWEGCKIIGNVLENPELIR